MIIGSDHVFALVPAFPRESVEGEGGGGVLGKQMYMYHAIFIIVVFCSTKQAEYQLFEKRHNPKCEFYVRPKFMHG